MLSFLKDEGISAELLDEIKAFRERYPADEETRIRIPKPKYHYYGNDVWEKALTALLAGENILLVGPKATGKNVLAENLSAVFARPEWNVAFYLNADAASLVGSDTFRAGEVSFRPGPITQCAQFGGFGILDEINMAKNESLAVLHAALDFRRILDVPGYERIQLHEATRFIGTMNYGYAGTRELNEALVSRFTVIQMPVIGFDALAKLLSNQFPQMKTLYIEQFSALFQELREKCESSEISTKALDLRGLLSSIELMRRGLTAGQALELGITNKSFDGFERQLVEDLICARISPNLTVREVFER